MSIPISISKEEGQRIVEAAKNQLKKLISKQLPENSSGRVVKRNLFQEKPFEIQANASVSSASNEGNSWDVKQFEDCGPSTSRQCYSTSFKPSEKAWDIETISSSDSDTEFEAVSGNFQFNSSSSKRKIISRSNQESFDSDDECEAIMVNIVNSSLKQKTTPNPPVKKSLKKRKSETQNDSTNSVEKLNWVNFLTHLLEIQRNENLWYLFILQDIAIFNSFAGLSTKAQEVYVKLLNSDYCWHRVSTLKYPEIGLSIGPIVHILIENNFVTSDISSVEIIALLDLLSLSDMKSLCQSFYLRDDGNKETLTKSLMSFCDSQGISSEMNKNNIVRVVRERVISCLGMVIKLTKEPRDIFTRTMLLYSLPHSRSMKSDGRIPLLSTMNRVSEKKTIYPTYPLRPLQNLFASRESLLRFQNALELVANIKENMMGLNSDKVIELHRTALSDFIAEAENIVTRKEVSNMPLFLRMFTAGTILAEAVLFCQKSLRKKKMYYEMIHSYQAVLNQDIYLTNCHGVCYEQLALIYHQYIKDIPKAIDCLIEALADPNLNPTDRVLLSNRGLLLINQKKRKKADKEKKDALASMLISVTEPPEITLTARSIRCNLGKKSSVNYIYETEEGIGQILSSVKEIVLLHHKQMGFNQGIHPKDSIGTSIFGILFWDIIYSCDVPNVFICPYQSRPLDLNTGEFYKNRKELIDKRLGEIEDLWSWDKIEYQVRRVWLEEKPKESLVSWTSFDNLKQIEEILDCLSRDVLAKICSKLAKEFTTSHKGFPPIFIWNQETRKCKFIKVVEPSEVLSVFEKFWLSYLHSIGADVAVCHVKITGEKSQKKKIDVADNTDALDIIS